MIDRNPDRDSEQSSFRTVRKVFIGLALIGLIAIFLVWRIDSERMERVRTSAVDVLLPTIEFGNRPLLFVSGLTQRVEAHFQLAERNSGLELEVERLKFWREEARRLEQQNARLRELLDAQVEMNELTVSAQVLADTNSQFRHSVLISVGTENGVADGWPVLDNEGLVGRISGVGRKSARVVLLPDLTSRIPIKIEGTGARGVVVGDGTLAPSLEFVSAGGAAPGNRVMTSGDGGVFPSDLLVGDVIVGSDQRERVRLSADIQNLEYVSVLRSAAPEEPLESGDLILGAATGGERTGP